MAQAWTHIPDDWEERLARAREKYGLVVAGLPLWELAALAEVCDAAIEAFNAEVAARYQSRIRQPGSHIGKR